MKYAAVILPTVCRYEHLIRCIQSLKQNPFARYTDVYVGLDCPRSKADKAGNEKIRAYLQGDFSEFRQFYVFERKRPYGIWWNFQDLRRRCCAHHDRYIYLEDDLEFSPNFLEYMNRMLERYETDETVIGVTGYSSPVAWRVADGCGAFKQNVAAYTWGLGCWRDKTASVEKFLRHSGLRKAYDKAYKDGTFNKMTKWAEVEYTELVTEGESPHSILKYFSDMAFRIYLAVQDRFMISPVLSKVRNNGFDGSGQWCAATPFDAEKPGCSTNYNYAAQPMDTETSFSSEVDEHADMDFNRSLYNAFDRVEPTRLQNARKQAASYMAKTSFQKALLHKTVIVRCLYGFIRRQLTQ